MMKLEFIFIGLLFFNQGLLKAQNTYNGVVADARSKALIIYAKVDFPMQDISMQTEMEAKFELSSTEDSVFAYVQYTGYQLAKKMLIRGQDVDTIMLEEGLSIPPASVMINTTYPTQITNTYIKEESENRLYQYWKNHDQDSSGCYSFQLFKSRVPIKVVHCNRLEVNIKKKTERCLLFNLYTKKELKPDRILDLRLLPKGIYELYITTGDHFWFNTPYENLYSGRRIYPIIEPVAIIYNFYN